MDGKLKQAGIYLNLVIDPLYTIVYVKNSVLFKNELACNVFTSRKNILIGVANKIKILAVWEVRPKFTSCLLKK